MKTREWSNLILFYFLLKTALFGHILKKNPQHIHFWYMVIPLGPHLVYT